MLRLSIFVFCFIFPFSLFSAENEKKVPLHYVKEYFPPQDSFSTSYPAWFLVVPERLRIERLRLSAFKKRYGLDEVEKAKQKKEQDKPIIKPLDIVKKKKTKRQPKRYVYGYYFDEVTKVPIVNVNGKFVSLSKLLKARKIRILRSSPGLLVVQANNRTYRIEVGKRLPL